MNWRNVSTNSPVNGTIHLAIPPGDSVPREFYRSLLLR